MIQTSRASKTAPPNHMEESTLSSENIGLIFIFKDYFGFVINEISIVLII